MISKCQCQSCGGEIEFDAAEFQESGRDEMQIFGQSVPCPHCGMETALAMPAFAAPSAPEPKILNPWTRPLPTLPKSVNRAFNFAIFLALLIFILWKIFVPRSSDEVTTKSNASTSLQSANADDSSQASPPKFPIVEASPPANPPKVSISDVEGEIADYGGMDITGIIQNLSSVSLESVTVNFSYFDDDGNKVDDAMDFIQTLGPDETWKFKVSSLKDDCKKYRLDSVTSIIGDSEVKLDVEQN